MEIRLIRTESDYKATLKEVSLLVEGDSDLGTPEGDRLDVLATLVQAYEAKHYLDKKRLISDWCTPRQPVNLLGKALPRCISAQR